MTTEETKPADGAPKRALTVRDAENVLLDPKKSIVEGGRALMALPIPSRALALVGAYHQTMDATPAAEADHQAEMLGRKFERVLEETGTDQEATLRHMLEAGDAPIVLAMVRGEAGEFSSTAEHLTPELIDELFAHDPEMNDETTRASRLITIAYTLVCETQPTCRGVNTFFGLASEAGIRYMREIAALARGGDEDAQEIVRIAKARGIPVPSIETEDEDEEDEREVG